MTWGCSDDKYDDTEIRQEIENLKQEIASMKEQVNSLKTIIDALNENKFITNYTEAADGSCTITFNDGKTITLHCASHSTSSFSLKTNDLQNLNLRQATI